jgi:hypothetical protein
MISKKCRKHSNCVSGTFYKQPHIFLCIINVLICYFYCV